MKSNQMTFLAFWAINDELRADKARSQLLEMKRLGLDGVIFHPRNYPGKPEYLGKEYMAVLSDIILYAKSIGMEFWLYDENGFPSGTASGKVLLENPDAKCMWLEYSDGNVVFREKNVVSTLDEKVCRDFVRITFDGYKQGLSAEAFDYFAGVFSDEVAFLDGVSVSIKYGGVPWCRDLAGRYRERYGETLTEKLPLLFQDGEGCEQVRERYWELLSKMLRRNFYAPIHQWCEENKKHYTAHLKGEETVFFNLSYNGSPYEILQEVSVPAVDALERYQGNHYYPHIASSVARQFFDGSCLCEAMGGSGWGVSPKDFVAYMKWLAECGINMFTFHLSQYTLNAQAIRDWPPSVPFHVSWREAFPEALRRIRKYGEQLAQAEREKERVLIVAPTRGCMRRFLPQDAMCLNEHNGAGTPDTMAGKISSDFGALVERCYQAGILYDVTEEAVLEKHGRIGSDGIWIGKMHYRHVVLGEGCCFREKETLEKLREYGLEMKTLQNGGTAVQESPVGGRAAKESMRGESAAKESVSGQDAVPEGVSGNAPFQEDAGEWEVLHDGENQMLLEAVRQEADRILRCHVKMEDMDESAGVRLVMSDPAAWVRANGQKLRKTEEGYEIPGELLRSSCLLIEIALLESGEQSPFVFLRGDFLVKNKCGYRETDHGQLYTEGAFILSGKRQKIDSRKLVQSGFPFRSSPVICRKKIRPPEGALYLKLSDFAAAAARVRIGDGEPVWIFSEEEHIRLPEEEKGKECLIWAELYPSTYNAYGPHHHRDGDRHLISPAQYSGRKNFADFADSPEQTLVEGYHFVKFGLGNRLIYGMEEDQP